MVLFSMACESQKNMETPSKSSSRVEIIKSENHGGSDEIGFTLISSPSQFQSIMSNTANRMEPVGHKEERAIPGLGKDEKALVYYQGSYRSGSHAIRKVLGHEYRDGILTIYVPQRKDEPGQMEIQVLSNPWFVLRYPAKYDVRDVKIVGKMTKDGQ